MFDHENLKVFFEGKIVPFEDAKISISNTAFLYGLGVFTGMRAHYNKETDFLYLFRPKEHYERFRFACKLLRYEQFLKNYDYQKFLNVILSLLKENKIKHDVYIRVTNYSDENKISPNLLKYKDNLCAFLYPLGDYVPTDGMKCKVSSWTRAKDNMVPARAKIVGLYVNTALAKSEALMDDYDEALFLDDYGNVVEGSAENLFIVTGGKLITPPVNDSILEGITRASVIQLAESIGLEVQERSIARSELYKADEVFLTGTGAKVSPVVEIDQYLVSDGKVGEVAAKLQSMYFSIIRGEDEKFSNWLVNVYN